jgi:hypothetical protein
MWYIIVAAVFVLGFMLYPLVREKDYLLSITLGLLVSIILVLLGFNLIIPATSGLLQNYSKGECSGYITKIAREGIVWKTYEGEMQIATAQIFEFSISDWEVLGVVAKFSGTGERVKVSYNRWLIMPFRVGASGYTITDIEKVEGEGKREE